MKNKRYKLILIITTTLLLIPLIAMQFTDEVNWAFSDFVIATILLLSTGFSIDFVLKRVKKSSHKLLISLAILALLFLVWAELAVGIFGTPFSGN